MQSGYSELTVLGFIAAVLVLIPLPRQIRARNIATTVMILCFFEHCFVVGVDTIVWAGNVKDSARAWCEITSYIGYGVIIALPAATLCICKHLEFISSGRFVSLEKNQWRRTYFELFMCVVLPCLWMFVFYCFQAARYVIVENFGCAAAYWPSLTSVIILFVPPLVLAVITLVYGTVACYNLIHNHRIRTKFLTPLLTSRNTGLSSSQYYRLMAMSMTIGIWGVVWGTFQLINVVKSGLYPLVSWSAIHEGDSTVIEIPLVVIGSVDLVAYWLFWWIVPGAAYIFFLLFGTSSDIFLEYKRLWISFGTTVLGRPLPEEERSMPTLPIGSTPSFVLPMHVNTSIVEGGLDPKHALSSKALIHFDLNLSKIDTMAPMPN